MYEWIGGGYRLRSNDLERIFLYSSIPCIVFFIGRTIKRITCIELYHSGGIKRGVFFNVCVLLIVSMSYTSMGGILSFALCAVFAE
jgi:hypothetical protein